MKRSLLFTAAFVLVACSGRTNGDSLGSSNDDLSKAEEGCALDGGPAPVDPVDPIDAGPAPDANGPLDGGAAYDPCGNKGCGDTCTLCAPWDPTCVETAVLKFCHSSGECLATPPACIPPPPYFPCAGKACGDACTICDPTDPNCFETAVLKQCDAAGACVANVVVCQ